MRLLPLMAGAGAVGWAAPALAPIMPSLCDALRVSRRLESMDARVALTFDDGPHPEDTPAILATLERAGARATFFMVGEQVERNPGLAAEVAAAGHGIALHGYRHRNLLRLSPGAVADDLDRGTDAVMSATRCALTLYRPAYGIFSSAALALVRRRGLRPLLWSQWGRDWTKRATPTSIVAHATKGLCAGDVVLLHDADFYSAEGSWRHTAAALPRLLDAIDECGLRAVAV